MITAFGNYCERMIAEFQPDFLCYAIEINMMAGAEPKRFDQLVAMAERVYPRLKAKHPKLLIFPTFQLDFGVPGNAGGEQAVRRLMPYSDAIAVSTYPHIRGFTPETLPAGWLADVRKLAPDKVFIVAETGYPAAPYSGTWRSISRCRRIRRRRCRPPTLAGCLPSPTGSMHDWSPGSSRRTSTSTWNRK